MFNPVIDISLGSFRFTYVHELSIHSTWKKLTDTAKIVLPANLKLDKNKLRELIAPGDSVKVVMGYEGYEEEVYTGFVTGIKPKIPLEFECEDSAWLLKQNSITDSLQNAKLSDMVSKHFGTFTTNIIDTEIGNYQIDNASQAKILQRIKEQFGLYSFFRGDVLVIGSVHDSESASRHVIYFEHLADNDLTYKRKEDIRLQVIAISNNADGSKTEYTAGDADGEKRTLNYYNQPLSVLKENAERELTQLKYDGYRGSATLMGLPIVRHGDIIEFINPEEADTTGSYWIDGVGYAYGQQGIRQKITLGSKA